MSTDDLEIAEISMQAGASVPWYRPKELSDDFTSTLSVIKDAVERLDRNRRNLQNICCIYPTTPFLDPNSLLVGRNILESGKWDYVISVTIAEAPPERFLSLGKSSQIVLKYPEHEFTRTQDLIKSYRDAGQFYWGKKSSWLAGLPLFTSYSTIVEVPREFSVDIDTEEDWRYAEALFKLYREDR